MIYHQPVLLKECIDGLNIRPDGIYVDVTFGGGGHSKEILKRLKKGRLFGFDQDEEAIQNIPKDKRFVFVRQNFRFVKNFMNYYKVETIDGLLADLGVSSHQFDSPQRGFSFRFDESVLDMRMNKESGFSAIHVINEYSGDELANILWKYGEIRNSAGIAGVICEERTKRKIEKVKDFCEIISGHIPKRNEYKYLARIFQAIRIEVNRELSNLERLLVDSVELIKPGGRLVMISYHSLEDRLVKNFMRSGKVSGRIEKDIYGRYNVPFKLINKKVIVPEEDEIKINSRAGSAKLRIAEKI